jgi:hypothetical protein
LANLFAISPRQLIARAGFGVAAVFLFFGVATGALPVQCLATTGTTFCPTPAGTVAPAARTVLVARPSAAATIHARWAPAVTAEPTISHNDLLASTFAVLKVDLRSPAAVAAVTTPAVSGADDGTLTTRVVKTTQIRVSPAGDVSVAEATPAQDPGAAPAPLTAGLPIAAAATPKVTTIAVAKPAAAVVAPVKVASVAPVTGGSSAVVRGAGANVRSSPSRQDGSVLFALAGGDKVKVLEDHRGWLHVVDSRGRSGWIYQDFISMHG